MIGLTIIDNAGNVTTYNPAIANNQLHFEKEAFQLGIELSALAIANQINAYVNQLDIGNVANITLTLNNNIVVYENE